MHKENEYLRTKVASLENENMWLRACDRATTNLHMQAVASLKEIIADSLEAAFLSSSTTTTLQMVVHKITDVASRACLTCLALQQDEEAFEQREFSLDRCHEIRI